MSGAVSPGATIVPQKGNKGPALTSGMEQPRKRPVKRRASKACASCRARKVRCNVVEHGAPCTNCRLDQVECVIAESKRKRKPDSDRTVEANPSSRQASHSTGEGYETPRCQTSHCSRRRTSNTSYADGHMPHQLYQSHSTRPSQNAAHSRPSFSSSMNSDQMSPSTNHLNPWPLGYRTAFSPRLMSPPLSAATLPDNIKPLPARIDSEESEFLYSRGALSLPSMQLRNEILRSYTEYVDPFMPVMNLVEFLQTVEHEDGSYGQVSLQLFQAIMFAGSAFVDFSHLKKAGFSSRREARKSFFQRARLLYDFDYDTDRMTLVQAVLLMTYWWDAPDDQKDTWHWMGIAISMAQSIGLNNDPSKSHLDIPRQRLWKRIWWSCVTRDRLISIGMRRTMRIKKADYNVPLPELEDFELESFPSGLSSIPIDCSVANDLRTRRLLAQMFIEKSKLSICIGNVMSHYSVPEQRIDEEGKAKLSGLSMPKKSLHSSEIRSCHDELQSWLSDLPDGLKISDSNPHPAGQGDAPVVLHRALLHLVYYMTLATLHRPLPISDTIYPTLSGDAHESPRFFVRFAAYRITDIAHSLLEQGYQRYLPTTGVTVLQPALISHLIDMKSPSSDVRREGLRGFCRCVHVLSKLRDCFSAAEFTLIMVETSIRHANIDITDWMGHSRSGPSTDGHTKSALMAQRIEDLILIGLRNHLVTPVMTVKCTGQDYPLTPPSEDIIGAKQKISDGSGDGSWGDGNLNVLSDSAVAQRLEQYLAPNPPAPAPPDANKSMLSDPASTLFDPVGLVSGNIESHSSNTIPEKTTLETRDLDREFESLMNTDKMTEAMTFGDGGFASLQGESSGFFMDIDWMNGGAFPSCGPSTPFAPVAALAAEDLDLSLEKMTSHQSVLSGFNTSVSGDGM